MLLLTAASVLGFNFSSMWWHNTWTNSIDYWRWKWTATADVTEYFLSEAPTTISLAYFSTNSTGLLASLNQMIAQPCWMKIRQMVMSGKGHFWIDTFWWCYRSWQCNDMQTLRRNTLTWQIYTLKIYLQGTKAMSVRKSERRTTWTWTIFAPIFNVMTIKVVVLDYSKSNILISLPSNWADYHSVGMSSNVRTFWIDPNSLTIKSCRE